MADMTMLQEDKNSSSPNRVQNICEWLDQSISIADSNLSKHSSGTRLYDVWSIEWQTLKRIKRIMRWYENKEEDDATE